MEVSLNKGEGPRILGIVNPATNKISYYKFKQGIIIEIEDRLARLITDKRFKVRKTKEVNAIAIVDKKTKKVIGEENDN